MKNILLLLTALFSVALHGQRIDQGDFVFRVSPGATLNYYERADSSIIFRNGESFMGIRCPVSAEYAFGKRVGISADFVYTRLNAGTMHASNFTVLDFGIGFPFYSLSSRRFFFFSQVGLHYSKLHYSHHGDFLHETTDATGYGVYFDLGAGIPLSSSKKFGMGLCLNGTGYKYPKAEYMNDFGIRADGKFNGLALSLGINFYYKI